MNETKSLKELVDEIGFGIWVETGTRVFEADEYKWTKVFLIGWDSNKEYICIQREEDVDNLNVSLYLSNIKARKIKPKPKELYLWRFKVGKVWSQTKDFLATKEEVLQQEFYDKITDVVRIDESRFVPPEEE